MPAPHGATAAALAAAHHAAVAALHAAHPGMRVGWSVANQVVQSVPGGEAAAAAYAELVEDPFLREAGGRRLRPGVQRTLDDGIDVRGYLHWSLLDNYEWGSYHARFGLVGWDPLTFDRTAKPSARWLGALARAARTTG